MSGVPEYALNALARRLDWRVLLPDPALDAVAHDGDAHLAEALATVGGAEPVALAAAAPGSRGVVVLSEPDAATLAAAGRAVAPGGAVYVEWRRAPRGPGGLERALAAAGLGLAGAYWPTPWPDRAQAPRVWVPVAAAEPMSWYRGTRAPAGRAARLAWAAETRTWQAARRGGALASLAVVAVPAGAAVPEPWMATLARRAAAHAPAGTPEVLLLTGGRASRNKRVGLVFAPGAARPALAVKTARTAAGEVGLRHEADVLDLLARTPGPGVHPAPRLVFRHDAPGGVAVGTGVAEGTPVLDLLTPDSHGRITQQVTDVLLALARRSVPAAPDHQARLIDGVQQAFRTMFAGAVSSGEVAEAERRLATLPSLPPVVEHRDCSPWNVLRTPDGDLVLLDWESAEPAGLPMLDLHYFQTFAALALEGRIAAADEATYRRTWNPASGVGRRVAACERRYLTGLGLPAACAHPLRLLTWMVHARSEHARLLAERGGGTVSTAVLAGATFVRLWRAELRRGWSGP